MRPDSKPGTLWFMIGILTPPEAMGVFSNRLAEWTSRQVEAEWSYARNDLSPNQTL